MMLRFCSLICILFVLIYVSACSGNDEPSDFDCSTSDLALGSENVVQPTNCTGDGSITVLGTGGKEPYKYALNTGSFGNSAEFNNLGAGDYTLRVKDKNGCEASIDISLQLPGADPLTLQTSATSDTECVDNNGVIELTASGGQEPYEYRLGSGAFGNESSFEGLAPGNYSVTVRDALGCLFIKGVTVSKGNSNTSLVNDIKPIIDSKCATAECHGGPENPNLTSLANIRTHAAKIKTLTQSGEMPREGSLSPEEKALIACWVDEGAKDN